MRTSILRASLLTAVITGALFFSGGIAHAEADTFGLGSGRDGAVTITAATTVINTYAPVTAAITAGATSISVGTAGGAGVTFAEGQLVMILQTRGGFAAAPASGSATAVALSGTTKTGRYELARIAKVAAGTLTLTHGTVNAFDANDTQVLTVPEYTTLTINAGATLVPQAWSRTTGTGGIVAFLATGDVANAGVINTSATGFEGGIHLTSTTETGCAALDGTPAAGGATAGGAHKGEGLDPTASGAEITYVGGPAHHFGRGNVTSSGGGGDCFNAGGGGGGHGGKGGNGGDTNADTEGVARAVGGEGGDVITYDPAVNLTLGGGGGAGEDDDGVGGNGGAGGGTLWMRAASLSGAGTIDASGGAGGTTGTATDPIYADGAGGGGAGGGVYVWVHGNADCGGINAKGGVGGNSIPAMASIPARLYGPGGGGAGGIVKLSAAGGTCTASTTAGANGVTSGNSADGATTGGAGASSTSGAFATTTCNIAGGQCGGCTDNTFCPAATPVCMVDATAAQYTCVAPAAYGTAPAGGDTCTAGLVPTQGTSLGCLNDLCDTSDNKCGYANGTTCGTNAECRSGNCDLLVCKASTSNADAGADGGIIDGGSADGGESDGGVSTNDGGTKSDAGNGGDASTNSDGGNVSTSDGGNNTNNGDASDQNEASSLEGGGIDCNSAPASPSNVLVFFGLAGIVSAFIRRSRKRHDAKSKRP